MELSSDWVVGFIDCRGIFYVNIVNDPEGSKSFKIEPEFKVPLPKRDIQVLYGIKRFFKCGSVKEKRETAELVIRKMNCLMRVVDFFQTHPMKTKNNVEFRKFAKVVRKMEQKRHLTDEGLKEIINIVMKMGTADRNYLKQLLKTL